jgi:hypothetical protein
LGDIRGREIWLAGLKIGCASCAMGAVMYVVARWLDPVAVRLPGQLVQLGAASVLGLGAFLGVALALKAGEVMFILGIVSRKLGLHGKREANQ